MQERSQSKDSGFHRRRPSSLERRAHAQSQEESKLHRLIEQVLRLINCIKPTVLDDLESEDDFYLVHLLENLEQLGYFWENHNVIDRRAFAYRMQSYGATENYVKSHIPSDISKGKIFSVKTLLLSN